MAIPHELIETVAYQNPEYQALCVIVVRMFIIRLTTTNAKLLDCCIFSQYRRVSNEHLSAQTRK
jgi:hypothetical protein